MFMCMLSVLQEVLPELGQSTRKTCFTYHPGTVALILLSNGFEGLVLMLPNLQDLSHNVCDEITIIFTGSTSKV